MSLDDFIVQLRFFVPSKALTKTILDLNAEFLGEAEDSTKKKRLVGRLFDLVTGGSQVDEYQRVIAERLYRFLASVARESKHSDEVVWIWDCIPHGMATMVGFPEYTEIEVRTEAGIRAMRALHDLAQEFRDWLKAQETYLAPWGELQMLDEDRLRLFPDEEPQDRNAEAPVCGPVRWERERERQPVPIGSVVRR